MKAAQVRGRRVRRGFTLLELLIVMGIIGVLVALLFPVIGSIRLTGQRTQAQNEAGQLDAAVRAYLAEYGKLPIPTSDQGGADKLYSGTAGAAIVKALVGLNGTGAAEVPNPRKTAYLQAQGTAGAAGTYEDPWGTPYAFAMDCNYDGRLDASIYSSGFNNSPTSSVIVISFGRNRKVDSPKQDKGDAYDDLASGTYTDWK